MKNIYQSKHPLVAHKLTLLRENTTESKNFRALVREISALLTYEATVDLLTEARSVNTPLKTTLGSRT